VHPFSDPFGFDKLRKYIFENSFQNSLLLLVELWQSNSCTGERPMKYTTQNSMRRLERLEPSCTGRRAWFVSFQ
jgi:hypothetical protein